VCILAAGPHFVWSQPAADLPEHPFATPFPWNDPPAVLERFLGGQTTQDQQALEAIELSIGAERRLGGRAFAAYQDHLERQGTRLTSRGRDVQYVQQLVALVTPQMVHARRYSRVKVFVAASDTPDARCFPGGTVVIFRGLLKLAGSEAALVGVIGHELSHLDHGHQLVGLRRLKLAEQSLTRAARGDFDADRFFQDGAMLMRLFARPFRPEDEAQADADGATWAYRLGYDPREMAALFLRMNAQRAGPEMPISLLRSHPFDEQRHRAVITRYRELTAAAPPRRLYVGRENLARRTPRQEQEFPE
jgi:predicted Zn-dependent protease